MASSSASPLLGILPASSVSSSFLPLTTVFPVPTSCFEAIYYAIFTSPAYTAFRDYSAVSSDCYPESYSQFEYPTVHPGSSWYSPGVCPSGYPIASSSYDDEASATRAWCCPGPASKEVVPTFPWGGDGGRHVCISRVTTSTSLLLPGGTTVVTDFFSAYDWPISVMWAQSDLMNFTPASAPLLVSETSTESVARSTGGGASTSSSSSSSSRSSSGSSHGSATPTGLSTGAKAGIGVGVALGVVALLVIGFLVHWRRRRNAARNERPANVQQSGPILHSEPTEYTAPRPIISEMDSNNKWTLQHTQRSELEANAVSARAPL